MMAKSNSTFASTGWPAIGRTRITPMQAFNLVSLCLIVLMVLAVGFAQTVFYRDAMLQRQGNDIRDVAEALAAQNISPEDMENYRDPEVQDRFERSFSVLRNLSELASIRVYNMHHDIVWSENPSVIGGHLHAEHEIETARTGKNVILFYSPEGDFRHHEDLPEMPLVEFHVPLYLRPTPLAKPHVGGMVAVFRSTETLNQTLAKGTNLIWLVTGLGGILLYAALALLFRSVYRRQRQAEMLFSELVTKQHEQQRMVQMEKLSTIGMMIGGIAHQINNPLVGVVNTAQLAEREVGDPDLTRESLADIRKAGEHCRAFLQRLLKFTQISGMERKPTELKELIDETISLFHQSAETRPRMVIELPDEPLTLDVDPVLIRHALFNLLSNAVQANAVDGTITVRLFPETRAENSAAGWCLTVADQGPGLSEDIREKIFTPFFSTRPEGTGLGLSVVQHVAILHDGQITAANNSGGGAVFSLWLPESRQEANGDTQDPHRR
jgi:signal transduction histidine kinase